MRTASALPVFAQVRSGVSPVAIAVFGLAPDFRSNRTSAAFPLVHASDTGVIRQSFAALAPPPAPTSRPAVSRSFQWADHSSAVEPSPERTLTSAFLATSA